MPVLGSLQAGMMTDPCREGGGEGARKPGTRGWRHADRRRGSTQDGDTGARRTETQEHAGRRHRSTQDGDTGARRTETRGHAERRHRSTQDGDTGARRTETQEHAERRHRSTQDGDTGARRTETRGHAGQRRGSTQDGDGGDTQTQMARNRQNCGKSGSPPTLLRPRIQPVAYTTNKRPGRKNDRAPF